MSQCRKRKIRRVDLVGFSPLQKYRSLSKIKKRLADGINERQSIFNQARILLRLVPFLLTR
jgi:hypothetical protein